MYILYAAMCKVHLTFTFWVIFFTRFQTLDSVDLKWCLTSMESNRVIVLNIKMDLLARYKIIQIIQHKIVYFLTFDIIYILISDTRLKCTVLLQLFLKNTKWRKSYQYLPNIQNKTWCSFWKSQQLNSPVCHCHLNFNHSWTATWKKRAMWHLHAMDFVDDNT